jgi:hypothetical protein
MPIISVNSDQTTTILDTFYDDTNIVPTNEYDIVHSYFIANTKNKTIAENFTSMIFRISQETKIDALELLDFIKGKDKLEANRVICYYLNSFKSKSSLYGISSLLTPIESVQRNIVL